MLFFILLCQRDLCLRVSALEDHLLIKGCSHIFVASYTLSLLQVYFKQATLLKRPATDATELHCKWLFKERTYCISVNYFYSYFSNTNGRQGLVFPQISFWVGHWLTGVFNWFQLWPRMRSLQVFFCYSEGILLLFFHVGPLNKKLIILRHLCFINNLKHAIINNSHQQPINSSINY